MAVHPQFLPLPPSHHNYQNSNPLLSLSFHSNIHPKSTHLYPKHSIVCFASSNKSRASRKLMSDEELRNCLKDFVSSLGLPHHHVPSTKQLSQHGRKDLANIVRRRGHKLIKELLVDATKSTTDEYDSLGNWNAEVNESRADEEIGQEEKVTDYSEESTDLINNESPLDASSVMTPESAACSDNESPLSEESPVSLQEKVHNFMKYGQLDAVEDDAVNLGGHNLMIHDKEKLTRDSSSTGSNGSLILERSISPPAEERSISPPAKEIYTREIHLSTQSQQNIDIDLGMGSEVNTIQSRKMDNEVEIDRLKLMLHQKELELSRLKKDIEKEKEALSILQTKAEDEISKAQQLITEKEVELQVAEESLSGLVEAKIYYSGEGEVVEVAGSFNGWHQRIKMDPQISSVIVDPMDPRKSKLWSATLWLYPGVYEMKFIVDGQWRIDPQREITLRHGVENNVLRVDR